MQGYPLDMFAYKIWIITLIKLPMSTYPDVKWPRYADDYGAPGTFYNLEWYFK